MEAPKDDPMSERPRDASGAAQEGTRASPARGWCGPRTGVLLFLAALLACEFGLRAFGYERRIAAVGDPELGWVLLPDQSTVQDGRRVTINRLGHYGDDWPEPQTADVDGEGPAACVAVLGSSFSVGPWVTTEERWTEVLEARSGVTVMNFAISGYGLDQMRAVYEKRIAAYRPKTLIVELSDGSVLPKLVPADASSRLRRWLVRSALYDAWTRYVTRDRGAEVSPPRSNQERARIQRRRALAAAPMNLGHRAAWDSVREGLQSLVAAQAAHGGEVVVLAAPMARHVAETQAVRPIDLVREWAVAGRLRILDPLPRWRPLGTDLFLENDPVHWNAKGHERIADEVEALLR